MSDLVDELAARAKVLSREDRARLAEELLASLEDGSSAEVDAAWEAEIQRRVADVEAGGASLAPAADVFARVRRSLR